MEQQQSVSHFSIRTLQYQEKMVKVACGCILYLSLLVFSIEGQLLNPYASQIGLSRELLSKIETQVNALSGYLVNTQFDSAPYNSQLHTMLITLAQDMAKARAAMRVKGVVIGNGNAVDASGAIVIGNNDTVKSPNIWVFTSNYHQTSIEAGIFVIKDWKFDLSKLFYALIYPPFCVIRLGQFDFRKLFDQYASNTKGSNINRVAASGFDLSALRGVDLTKYGF